MKTKEMLNSLVNLCWRELNNNHYSEEEAIESAKRRFRHIKGGVKKCLK